MTTPEQRYVELERQIHILDEACLKACRMGLARTAEFYVSRIETLQDEIARILVREDLLQIERQKLSWV